LRILSLLRTGELCVCDLVRVLDLPQPKVSRHLAYLRRAGLVLAHKDGLWMHYRLAPAPGKLHRRLLASLDACLEHAPALRRDAALLRRSRNRLNCC
jgi:ArsR family transcriptional regulator